METTLKIKELISAHEVQVHYKRPVFDSMIKITSSRQSETIFRKYIDAKRIDHKEFFWILLLNNSNKLLGLSEISIGNDLGVIVNVKEIFQLIINTNSSSVILCHNHPSGNINPSTNDKLLTSKMIALAEVINVKVLDHIILTSESYFSFADNGMMI